MGRASPRRAGSRIKYPPLNQTELKLGPGNYAIGLSTNEGVRFQGFHGDHILIVLDEAPGVLPEIWEAIEGIRADPIFTSTNAGGVTDRRRPRRRGRWEARFVRFPA